VDHTYLRAPGEGIMLGGLAGYNNTHGNFSGDPNVTGAAPRTQDIDGAVLGLYGSYFHRGFAIDLLAKTDIFDFDQTVQQAACGGASPSGSTSLTDLLVASNVYFRRNMGAYWLEPTAGFRYIHSYFGDGAAALGVTDGDALRLQAGLRIGTDWVDVERRLWSVSFLAGVYSDVVVSGFTAGGGTGEVTLQTDEGKVRAIGQLRAKVRTQDGLTYYGQAEIRGGDDYFGVAGKVGVRYDW
jgi:outer membrane autotransporter protein